MKKTYLYSILAALLLAAVAFLFFFPDDVKGNVLQQQDIQQGLANGEEGRAFHETTGETTRWTDALFGGMPNFQISPSYPAGKALDWIWKVYTLWLPSPANLLFAMLLGFFIMCLCMGMKWELSLFGAIAWGFSTYFIIIIGAGHIWKFMTLAFIPPTIAGLALAYRGKYLYGAGLTALFGSLQIQSNHPQMSYYFGFVMLAFILAWLFDSIHSGKTKQWAIATLCVIGSGALAIGVNLPSLYNTYEYSKETVRGRSTLLADKNGALPEGMSNSAITAWSYGLDETFTLLIPNVKGGASGKPVAAQQQIVSVAESPKAEKLAEDGSLSQQEVQFLNYFPQYFGEQPMTNGPVYVGAFILLLAILALFIVPGRLKWFLLGAALLALFLSWGHNFSWLTDFFIANFPGYNKFRTVSSFLVVVEFIIPLLAVMCVRQMILHREDVVRQKTTIYVVMGVGIIICLAGWLMPSIFGSSLTSSELDFLNEQGIMSNPAYYNVIHALNESRMALVSADSLRSLMFIILGCLVMWLYLKRVIPSGRIFVLCLTAVTIIDLFPVNKRYVDSENFVEPLAAETTFTPTEADIAILRDKGHYRVMDVGDMDGARSSYFHKTVGGYHAAKLTRYEDLLKNQIKKGNMNVINMLNTKYILDGNEYDINPEAYGPAWFVSKIEYVDGNNAEMAALDTLDTRNMAVADKSFSKILGSHDKVSPNDSISLIKYAPNCIEYESYSQKGGIGVFSEIWFPWGWNATIDGKPTEIARVDYVLRALNIPAGKHKIIFTFDPQSVHTTETLSIISVVLVYLVCLSALGVCVFKVLKRHKEDPEEMK